MQLNNLIGLDLKALFEQHEAEYLNFDSVLPRQTDRMDLQAFLILDSLFAGKGDMVSASRQDVIFLSARPEEVARRAPESQIIDLIRCGVLS